ncbi:hypothetical protein [Sphingopyxis sp.]|uniref:hypothetical protein n=1 Tax=Sphingopyxis sp. TaxID=1908224 RepID=UPI0035B1075C
MDPELAEALEFLIGRDDDGSLFDRRADDDSYQSQGLEDALKVIRRKLRARSG